MAWNGGMKHKAEGKVGAVVSGVAPHLCGVLPHPVPGVDHRLFALGRRPGHRALGTVGPLEQ